MKHTIFLMTLIALVIGLGCKVNAAAAKVTFRAEAQVQPGFDVTVKDVAEITASGDIAAKVGAVQVARAPLAGQSRTMGTDYIKRKIVQAAGQAAVEVSGPANIKLIGQCTRVSGQDLADAAQEYAYQLIPNDGRDYEVSVDPISREVIAPEGSDIRIDAETISNEMKPGLNSVRLSVKADGKSVGTTFASVRVKVTASVLVASDQIEKGAPLTDRNTVWDKRDVSKVTGAITDKGASGFQEFVAKKTIRPGTVITSADVAFPDAIRQGDTISLVVKCGKVVLQTSAEAKQTGSVGDTIRVLSPVSTGEVRAKILEPGLAEIRM